MSPEEGSRASGGAPPKGPPPLRPFGLVLHHDGSWSHEGVPFLHAGLIKAFDRSVRYLPEEGKYVVQLGRFRGEIEVEEAAFFVREADAATGTVLLSDGTREPLEPASLRPSPRDGALLATVKRELVPEGLPARFTRRAQAELFHAVRENDAGELRLAWGGAEAPLPALE